MGWVKLYPSEQTLLREVGVWSCINTFHFFICGRVWFKNLVQVGIAQEKVTKEKGTPLRQSCGLPT
jgi:hypothetical protein